MCKSNALLWFKLVLGANVTFSRLRSLVCVTDYNGKIIAKRFL